MRTLVRASEVMVSFMPVTGQSIWSVSLRLDHISSSSVAGPIMARTKRRESGGERAPARVAPVGAGRPGGFRLRGPVGQVHLLVPRPAPRGPSAAIPHSYGVGSRLPRHLA